MSRRLALVFAFGFILTGITSPENACAADVTLMAVGDILPHASWQKVQIPVRDLFRDARGEFYKADIVVGNLETSLTCRKDATGSKKPDAIKAGKDFVFKCEDEDVAQALKDAGFTLLTLSNNHSMDYKEDGLTDTLGCLKAAGIKAAGAGADKEEAERPAVVEAGEMKFIFVSASDVVPKGYEARPAKPGIASAKDPAPLAARVKALRADNPGAVIAVCLHWGVEATYSPTARQQAMARQFIDAGADLIIGHHPHRLQGVEFYKGRPILYSLGNFQFDTKGPGYQSAIAKLTFSGGREAVRVELMPVMIGMGGAPRVLKDTEPQYSEILRLVAGISAPLGSRLSGKEVSALPKAGEFAAAAPLEGRSLVRR